MEILIPGGTGFVGNQLSACLLERGHHVTVLGTRSDTLVMSRDRFRYVRADTSRKGDWQDELNHVDGVVNLAGRSIFKRWTKAYKKQLYESRILTTKNVVEGLPEKRDIIFLSTSASGYYGNRGDEILTEKNTPGNDFLARLSMDWEKEAAHALNKGIRLVITRFGVILDAHGGAMAKMIPPFRLFFGGPLGNGDQWFSWIHMQDLLGALIFLLERQDIEGPVNMCSPHPLKNRDLAKALGKTLHRPSLIPTPGVILRIMLGEFSSVLLSSQRMMPEKLMMNGFSFQYPEIGPALSDIIGSP